MKTKNKPMRLRTVFTVVIFIVMCTCTGMVVSAAMNAIDHKPAKSSSPNRPKRLSGA